MLFRSGNQVATSGGSALTPALQLENTIDFFSGIGSSSYVVKDSGIKYVYDRFSDKYRYIGCNGDVAGACVSTSAAQDDWFSPAGLNRGGLQNVVKLAFNPNKAQRVVIHELVEREHGQNQSTGVQGTMRVLTQALQGWQGTEAYHE